MECILLLQMAFLHLLWVSCETLEEDSQMARKVDSKILIYTFGHC